MDEFRSGPYLAFRVGRRELAIWAPAVRSVLQGHEILSGEDGAVAVQTHGAWMPVIDLKARLGLRGAVMGRHPSIVVVDTGEGLAAFLVDAVSDVIHARAHDFRAGKIRIGRPRAILDIRSLGGQANPVRRASMALPIAGYGQ